MNIEEIQNMSADDMVQEIVDLTENMAARWDALERIGELVNRMTDKFPYTAEEIEMLDEIKNLVELKYVPQYVPQ